MTDAALQTLLGPNGFYLPRGSSAVLLVHGLTGTPAEMRDFGRQLARQGLSVACPQLAGHCDSVAALKASRWEDWYDSVERCFEALAQRHAQVYVAGLSMGALLCLLLASRQRTRVAGLALLSPTFFYDGWNMPKLRQTLFCRSSSTARCATCLPGKSRRPTASRTSACAPWSRPCCKSATARPPTR